MNFNKKIKNIIDAGVNKKIFPSASVGIYFKKNDIFKVTTINSNNIYDKQKTNSTKNDFFYDLASLTKPLSTVLSILTLKKEGVVNTKDNLGFIFGKKGLSPDKKNISIENLLSHSAGFAAHQPFYKELVNRPVEERDDLLLDLLNSELLKYVPRESFLYSDLGFMFLGLIIKETSGLAVDEFVAKKVFQPVGLDDHLFFNRLSSRRQVERRFAPTENCPWRGRVLSGEVSDENCWALDGVAGHAGLFGDIEGVLKLVALILDIWKGRASHPNIDKDDLVDFLKKRDTGQGNTWTLGFDTPSPTGSSSGKYFSKTSVGHLGFTGTSFWIDPVRDLVIVFLTNRVHPDRGNELIKEFRPLVHDAVVETLFGGDLAGC